MTEENDLTALLAELADQYQDLFMQNKALQQQLNEVETVLRVYKASVAEDADARELLRKIVDGYHAAEGEMFIPDHIYHHIREAEKLLGDRASSA